MSERRWRGLHTAGEKPKDVRSTVNGTIGWLDWWPDYFVPEWNMSAKYSINWICTDNNTADRCHAGAGKVDPNARGGGQEVQWLRFNEDHGNPRNRQTRGNIRERGRQVPETEQTIRKWKTKQRTQQCLNKRGRRNTGEGNQWKYKKQGRILTETLDCRGKSEPKEILRGRSHLSRHVTIRSQTADKKGLMHVNCHAEPLWYQQRHKSLKSTDQRNTLTHCEHGRRLLLLFLAKHPQNKYDNM